MKSIIDIWNVLRSDWIDSSAWGHLSVVYPQRPLLWALLILSLAIAGVLARFLGMFSNAPRREFDIFSYGDAAGPDWNIVRINLSDAVGLLGNKGFKQGHQIPATIAVNGRTQLARLEMRQISRDALQMSAKMSEQLGYGGMGGPLLPAKTIVAISVPKFRWDIRTYKNPDPAIRLQWQLGFLFLVLGIVLPKAIDVLMRGLCTIY